MTTDNDTIPMPRADVNNLDEVVRELGIEDSDTTPAEAVRELKAEIERLRERCDGYRGQIEAGAIAIEHLRKSPDTAEVERLRERCDGYKGQVEAGSIAIQHLQGEIARLRAALKPFVRLLDGYEAALAGDEVVDWGEYVTDVAWPSEQECINARIALSSGKPTAA